MPIKVAETQALKPKVKPFGALTIETDTSTLTLLIPKPQALKPI